MVLDPVQGTKKRCNPWFVSVSTQRCYNVYTTLFQRLYNVAWNEHLRAVIERFLPNAEILNEVLSGNAQTPRNLKGIPGYETVHDNCLCCRARKTM